MTTLEILKWIQGTSFGHALGKADHLVGAVLQLLHIVGFLLLLAAVALVNLRLLGIGLKRQSIALIGASTSPLIRLGLGAAVFSGVIIFLSGPVHYYPNEAFWAKMLVLLFAIVFQFTVFRWVMSSESRHPLGVRFVAVAGLLLWFGVAVAGRTIGYI